MEAFAKINLFLDIRARRADGYHEIASIMQAVDLRDELIIRKSPAGITLNCNEKALPTDDNNIVIKAANLLKSEYEIPHGFEIELTKRIPVGAGLAGGSSDCAATLLGISALMNLQIPSARLAEIGKSLGADVPFCLTGGTALTEGIGEKITPLPPLKEGFFVIAAPEIFVSTREIFGKVEKIAPDAAKLEKITAAIKKKDLPEIAASFYNVFTEITGAIHPEIPALTAQLKALGALGAQMSGTGSAVFAYFESKTAAENAASSIKNSFVCRPVSKGA